MTQSLASFPSPTPEQLITWIICLVAVCGVLGGTLLWGVKIYAHWITIRDAGKKLPIEQPLVVKHVDVFVTKDDHRLFEAKVDTKLEKLLTGQAAAVQAAARREQSIKSATHRDILSLSETITAKVDENMSRVYHRINHMRERIARLEQEAGINPPAEEE